MIASRKNLTRMLGGAGLGLLLTGCVTAPPPKYQPGIDNTQTLQRSGHTVLGVGHFDAAAGVDNTGLSVRGSKLTGGSDGTFSAYLAEALVTELKTAGRYAENADEVISGTLTSNAIDAGVRTGTADVGAHFVVKDKGTVVYDKTLSAHAQWQSSFMGAVAIPAAMRNYATAVQKLLGKLFGDPNFAKAVNRDGAATPVAASVVGAGAKHG